MTARQEMACQRCLTPLNTLGDPPTYLHPLGADTDGHQPVPVPVSGLDTVARRCDFCGDRYPVWTLTGGDVGLLQEFGDRWAACATCHTLIEDGKVDGLVDRAAIATGLQHDRQGRAHLVQLHTMFLRDRRPGRTLITTTAWPATPIFARDLPRIRDRLARLYRSGDGIPGRLGAPGLRRVVADSLDRARLYWIDPEFTDLSEHAAGRLPDTPIGPHDIPAADGLLVWARPVTGRQIAAASWMTDPGGCRLACYRSVGAGLDGVPLQRLREQIGWLLPVRTSEIASGRLISGGDPTAALVATWLLIAQKVAESVPAPLDRAVRKAYARAKRPAPEVRILRIRAHAGRDRMPTSPAGSGRVYKGRFWVSGHWRNQAYGPGRALRRPVYIYPFLKGPQDQPIQPASTVRVLGTARARQPDGDD